MQIETTSQNIIEASDLSFSYGNHVVLDHVSFTVSKGSYVGIIGPNGGGKTTLLKLLLGLLKPKTGEIKILGTDITSLKNKYEIGYVPQRVSQDNISFPSTVYEIVESGRIPGLGLFGRFNNKDRELIRKTMEISGIENYKNTLIGDLSGGERQRVYVARALASNPKLLILDEPFVGIDIEAQDEFYKFLKKLNEEDQLTILFVSHDVDIISKEVKEVLCLNKRLVCSGSRKDINEDEMIEKLYGKNVTHIHKDL